MLLSDVDIREVIMRGELVAEDVDDASIQPASIDLHLSPYFQVFDDDDYVIDPKQDQRHLAELVKVVDHFLMMPGQFVLGSTIERFGFNDSLAGRLEGKSSLGRLGLIVHTTAGFFDPGFIGYPTIELVNLRAQPLMLYPGMPVAQMSIFRLDSPSENPYSGKYGNQSQVPALSKYFLNYSEEKP